MHILVLGAAAGGGFPQWNCNCAGCRRGRLDEANVKSRTVKSRTVKPRTQASIALSADGARWALLNASPDLPWQIRANPQLHPAGTAIRDSPINTIVLSGGDVDCIAGLLSLRESQKLSLYAGDYVRDVIEENPIFRVLNRDLVDFHSLNMDQPVALLDAVGAPLGMTVEAFPVAGKIPLYHETSDDITQLASGTAVIGLSIADAAGRKMIYIPGCAAVTDALQARIATADVLFFDGTLWEDDEMIRAGTGRKTGERMGHMSISGEDGSIAAFADIRTRKIFIHINNTNPILCEDSHEAEAVREAGWEIAYDGMAFAL